MQSLELTLCLGFPNTLPGLTVTLVLGPYQGVQDKVWFNFLDLISPQRFLWSKLTLEAALVPMVHWPRPC